MENLSPVLMITAAIVLLLVFLKLLRLPLKLAGKLLIHAVSGFVSLLILNFLGSIVGVSLDITFWRCVAAGVLGVPGVLLMLIFKYVL